MASNNIFSKSKSYFISFLKWSLFGLLMGALGGLLGAAFHHTLHFVTHLRSEHNWLLFLLPAGGGIEFSHPLSDCADDVLFSA